jgi:hypothetical protein
MTVIEAQVDALVGEVERVLKVPASKQGTKALSGPLNRQAIDRAGLKSLLTAVTLREHAQAGDPAPDLVREMGAALLRLGQLVGQVEKAKARKAAPLPARPESGWRLLRPDLATAWDIAQRPVAWTDAVWNDGPSRTPEQERLRAESELRIAQQRAASEREARRGER